MSVTTPETFKLTGGSVTDNQANIIKALAEQSIVGSYSGGVITITNAGLASTTRGNEQFEHLLRVTKAAGAKLAYVVAS